MLFIMLWILIRVSKCQFNVQIWSIDRWSILQGHFDADPGHRTLPVPVSIAATLQDCGQSGGQCLQPLNVIKFCK